MAHQGNRGPGRPRAGDSPLTREAILEAALRIVDGEGLPALSMRRLARELGVNPMSIYYHVPGKPALLSQLAEDVFSRMRVNGADDGAPWQDRFKAAARAFRQAIRAHPNLALQIVSDVNAVSSAVIASSEPFYAALDQAGLPPRDIVDTVDTTVDFIHGFMLGETATSDETFEIGPTLLERIRALPAGTAPALTRVTEALGEEGLRYEFDTGFENALNLIISGVEARMRR